jgi:hypothetical protein
MFDLDSEQKRIFTEWDDHHNCSLKKDSGAIGGRLSYQFTPTGLGQVVKVVCGCGAWVDLTDYADW